MVPFPFNFAFFSKCWPYFFGLLFDVNLCWTVSASSNKKFISTLSHNYSLLFKGHLNGLFFSFLTTLEDSKYTVCILFLYSLIRIRAPFRLKRAACLSKRNSCKKFYTCFHYLFITIRNVLKERDQSINIKYINTIKLE